MNARTVSTLYEEFHAERKKQGTVAHPSRLAFLKREIGAGREVVELGCRDGSLLSHFIDGNRVVGCDIDRLALRRCAERFGIPTHVANLNEALPFPASSFDVVVLSEVMEHLPYPEITLMEIRRVLRPHGRLVGSVPNATRWPNRFRFLLTGRVEIDPTHLHHFGPQSLRMLLDRHFGGVLIEAVAGRLVRFSPAAFANTLMFRCTAPRQVGGSDQPS